MNKIKENKVGIALALAGLAGLFLLSTYYYKALQAISRSHPTFQDLVKVAKYAEGESRAKINKAWDSFRKESKKYSEEKRKKSFPQYIGLIKSYAQNINRILSKQQKGALKLLSLNEDLIDKNRRQIDEQLIKQYSVQNGQIQTIIDLEEIRLILKKQINFLKREGSQVWHLLTQFVQHWWSSQPEVLSIIISVLVIDCTLSPSSKVNLELIERAEKKYEKQLMSEVQQLDLEITSVLTLLIDQLKSTGIKKATGTNQIQQNN